MYDIVCQRKSAIEQRFPVIKSRNVKYGVSVFHAYAHSMHCQVEFHPRFIPGFGYTDGEGCEARVESSPDIVVLSSSVQIFRKTNCALIYFHTRRETHQCWNKYKVLGMKLIQTKTNDGRYVEYVDYLR